MEILDCDNHLLVALKPAGIATQPHGGAPSLQEECKRWVKQKFQKPGAVFLEPVHRLDKEVSGIVLFARTSRALTRLQQAQRDRLFLKTYLAQVEGTLKEARGRLIHYLIHGDHCALIADQGDAEAKECILQYELVCESKGRTLLRIFLLTGRYHQIRCQLAAIGHPIIGDLKYGSSYQGALLLHHAQLKVPHPISKEGVEWQAPLPEYWEG
jgi:23S rRNA pseudouridine1911/1915/1917 synthase